MTCHPFSTCRRLGGAATPSLAALSTASFSHCGKKGISSFSGSYCGNYAVFA